MKYFVYFFLSSLNENIIKTNINHKILLMYGSFFYKILFDSSSGSFKVQLAKKTNRPNLEYFKVLINFTYFYKY